MATRRTWRRADDDDEATPAITGVVTGLMPSTRRPGRLEVDVDGKQAAVVSFDLVQRLGLRVGLALDERLGAALVQAAAELATYDRAVGLLAAQGRSAKELRRRLIQKGEPAAQVDAAIARLLDAGLVDDAAYARQLARSRALGRGDSRRRIAQVLGQRGVARELADEAVAEVFAEEDVDEEGQVEQAARKKLRGLGGLDPATRRRRLYGFLARRGHDGDAIRRVLARVLAAGEDEALDEDVTGADVANASDGEE